MTVAQATLRRRTVLAQEGAQFGRVELPMVRLDIDERRPGPKVADRVGRGDERERRHYDLVARLHARKEQCGVQRRCATAGSNRVFHAKRRGKLPLEELDDRAGSRDPSGS
jgi:hypothetical protein